MTAAAIDRCLESRDVGVRRAGPWRELSATRIAVPVVSYMSREPLGEYVLERKGAEFVWVKPRKEERHESGDPLAGSR